MKRALWLLLAAILAPPLAAQDSGALAAPRRAQLEAQLLQRFTQRAGRELRLGPAQQASLVRIVRETALERRQLNLAGADLARRLDLAVRDSAAGDSLFQRLLAQQRNLRQRELRLWLREQQNLAQVLSPRQHAHFTHLWLRLQEDARGLLLQRGAVPRTRQPGL
jgi:hypothetical protein